MKNNKKNKKFKGKLTEVESLIKEWFNNEFLHNHRNYLHPLFYKNIEDILKFGKRKELEVVINYSIPLSLECSENTYWETLYNTCQSQVPHYVSTSKKIEEEILNNWFYIRNSPERFAEQKDFWLFKDVNFSHLSEFDTTYSKTELRKIKVKYVLFNYKIDKNTLAWVNPFEYVDKYSYNRKTNLSIKEFVYKEKFDDFITEKEIPMNVFFEYFYHLLNETHIYKLIDINNDELTHKDREGLADEMRQTEQIYTFHENFIAHLIENKKEEKCYKNLEDKKMFYVEKAFIAQLTEQNVDLNGKHYILHAGPTNAGKSYNALQSYYKANKGCYLAPLRLLAYEIYDSLDKYELTGSLLTGENKIISPNSTHVAATVEMYQVLDKEPVDVLVIDECQMITDGQRGSAWLHGIVSANAREIHLISSLAAIPILSDFITRHNGTIEVKEYKRLIPLEVMENDITIHDLEKNDAVIAFSKNRILELVAEIQLTTTYKVSYLYGMMPPEIKMKQMDDFRSGLTDIMVTTDVIAMGLNLPIKRVIFSETSKFNGESIEVLPKPLYEQISGRAGRFGLFDIGYVTFSWNANRNDVINKRKESKTFELVTKQPLFEEYEEYLNNTDTDKQKTLLDYLLFWEKHVSYDINTYKKANIKEIIEVLESIDENLLKELNHKEQFFFAFLPYHKNRFTEYMANNLVDYHLYGNHHSENQARLLLQTVLRVNSFAKDIVLESQYSHLQTLSQYALTTENEILLELVKEEKERLLKNWEKTMQHVLKKKIRI